MAQAHILASVAAPAGAESVVGAVWPAAVAPTKPHRCKMVVVEAQEPRLLLVDLLYADSFENIIIL